MGREPGQGPRRRARSTCAGHATACRDRPRPGRETDGHLPARGGSGGPARPAVRRRPGPAGRHRGRGHPRRGRRPAPRQRHRPGDVARCVRRAAARGDRQPAVPARVAKCRRRGSYGAGDGQPGRLAVAVAGRPADGRVDAGSRAGGGPERLGDADVRPVRRGRRRGVGGAVADRRGRAGRPEPHGHPRRARGDPPRRADRSVGGRRPARAGGPRPARPRRRGRVAAVGDRDDRGGAGLRRGIRRGPRDGPRPVIYLVDRCGRMGRVGPRSRPAAPAAGLPCRRRACGCPGLDPHPSAAARRDGDGGPADLCRDTRPAHDDRAAAGPACARPASRRGDRRSHGRLAVAAARRADRGAEHCCLGADLRSASSAGSGGFAERLGPPPIHRDAEPGSSTVHELGQNGARPDRRAAGGPAHRRPADPRRAAGRAAAARDRTRRSRRPARRRAATRDATDGATRRSAGARDRAAGARGRAHLGPAAEPRPGPFGDPSRRRVVVGRQPRPHPAARRGRDARQRTGRRAPGHRARRPGGQAPADDHGLPDRPGRTGRRHPPGRPGHRGRREVDRRRRGGGAHQAAACGRAPSSRPASATVEQGVLVVRYAVPSPADR